MRQHVNPLGRFFQQPLELSSLTALFPRPHQPLHLDIGCARGRFLMDMAALYPQRNHLGLEIRRLLVEQAETQRQLRQLDNLHYLFCNVTVSLVSLTRQLAPEQLQWVTIQFPDPWFKRKHHKRRLLQDSVLNTLAAAMAPGSLLFLQSDVYPLMEDVTALVQAQGCFVRQPPDWWPENPLPVSTERERSVLARGLPVWRACFRRAPRDQGATMGA
ncbi:tRNA (guanosine(46)-N7)-methyltransferase TrmB [Candidatus Synechococcus spongiarum LMB bulk15M]|uniref:tRNA (guanine-N(7)-)-methyltransferase n=1 Tax=Candidatus Synechococcus spongiarum LMB bulk15M TaxID=1943582 RepID=A0A1T1D1P1_9SYNE|nr:tRNA (guanosine(46)-N7)-methyltransferase TrmB [Candidatus Synechococcus spongiarum LMB bulk15M]